MEIRVFQEVTVAAGDKAVKRSRAKAGRVLELGKRRDSGEDPKLCPLPSPSPRPNHRRRPLLPGSPPAAPGARRARGAPGAFRKQRPLELLALVQTFTLNAASVVPSAKQRQPLPGHQPEPLSPAAPLSCPREKKAC